MDLAGSVIRDGGIAQATGRVLVIHNAVWFQGPRARALPSAVPPSAPGKGSHAVRAHGVDANRLDRSKQYADGTVEGWATLTGTWRHHELHVHAQTSPPEPKAWTNRWTSPPSPPPPGGWPTFPIVGAMTAANLPDQPPRPDEWAELTITQITHFRPHPTQPVLVIAAGDPERVEQALRPKFGASLCVVASQYHQRDIDAAVQRLRQEMASRRWPITMTGRAASSGGQATVTGRFAWLGSEVVEWAATMPEGLLDLDVWLTPVT